VRPKKPILLVIADETELSRVRLLLETHIVYRALPAADPESASELLLMHRSCGAAVTNDIATAAMLAEWVDNVVLYGVDPTAPEAWRDTRAAHILPAGLNLTRRLLDAIRICARGKSGPKKRDGVSVHTERVRRIMTNRYGVQYAEEECAA
jgi:hypothetical protein